MQKLKDSLLLIFCLFLFNCLSGQSVNSDLQLIQRTITAAEASGESHHHSVAFPFPGTINPIKLALGSTMWLYQNLISPQLSASCLFEPSCSAYSVNLMKDYGIIRGMVFTADRLTRCNRMSARDLFYTRINPLTGHVRESTDFYRLSKHD